MVLFYETQLSVVAVQESSRNIAVSLKVSERFDNMNLVTMVTLSNQ